MYIYTPEVRDVRMFFSVNKDDKKKNSAATYLPWYEIKKFWWKPRIFKSCVCAIASIARFAYGVYDFVNDRPATPPLRLATRPHASPIPPGPEASKLTLGM